MSHPFTSTAFHQMTPPSVPVLVCRGLQYHFLLLSLWAKGAVVAILSPSGSTYPHPLFYSVPRWLPCMGIVEGLLFLRLPGGFSQCVASTGFQSVGLGRKRLKFLFSCPSIPLHLPSPCHAGLAVDCRQWACTKGHTQLLPGLSYRNISVDPSNSSLHLLIQV